MYSIKTLNKISASGLAMLDPAKYAVSDGAENEDGILVRSAELHDYAMPGSLLAIARAGAGTNNIPIDKCSQAGIVVFNTPGANANAVKELTLGALLLASRDVLGGAAWVKDQAAQGIEVADVIEKGKSQFVGPELLGKTLGVVGLGAIGVLVANMATELGMTVIGYDPFLSVEAALKLNRMVQLAPDLGALTMASDYITLHLPLNDKTKNTIDAAALAKAKQGVRIINLARGGLVNEDDLLAALDSGKVARYVTDFPTSRLMANKGVAALPHLGASTPESEENCAVMAAQQLADYLENGTIRNSVNLPAVELPWSAPYRLAIIHKNIPAMLSSITAALASEHVNVENMTNKSRGDLAYTIADVDTPIEDHTVAHIQGIDGVLRVRVLDRG